MIKLTRSKAKGEVHFDVHTVDKGHHKVTYRGVKTVKCPFDFVIYQMIIFDVKPDLIIEVGANNGGSALYMADLLNITGKGEIHTIDIVDRIDPLASSHPRIRFFGKGYLDYDISLASRFEKILVIEDASHMYDQTLESMNKFASLVSPGSYLIVEDGIVDALGITKQFDGGPLRAIREFLPDHPEFEIDRYYCDLFGKNATFNPDGYLKRKS
jgi:cephalosporin hydroxylase